MNELKNSLPSLGPYIAVPNTLAERSNIDSTSKLIFGLLYSLARKTGYVYAGDAFLAGKVGCSEAMVKGSLETLRWNGYIKTTLGVNCRREITICYCFGY